MDKLDMGLLPFLLSLTGSLKYQYFILFYTFYGKGQERAVLHQIDIPSENVCHTIHN